MAAAALLRSVASKMARAPCIHHRSLLARGIHGGAGSGPGVSLPPPTSNQYPRGIDRWLAREPPPQQHRLLHQRGLHHNSGSTLPPTSSKVFGVRGNEFPRAKIAAGVAYITLFGSLIYMYGWVKPAMVDQMNALSRERSILTEQIKAIENEYLCVRVIIKDMLADLSETQNMPRSGHGAVLDGATEKGTRVKNVEKEVAKVQCPKNRVKEQQAGFKNLQATIATMVNEIEEQLENVQCPENREGLKDLHAELTKVKIALERTAEGS